MYVNFIAVNGGWATWGSWGACSVTCGPGTQTRTRTCSSPTPQGNGATCPGSSTSSQACQDMVCIRTCHLLLPLQNKTSKTSKPKTSSLPDGFQMEISILCYLAVDLIWWLIEIHLVSLYNSFGHLAMYLIWRRVSTAKGA